MIVVININLGRGLEKLLVYEYTRGTARVYLGEQLAILQPLGKGTRP